MSTTKGICPVCKNAIDVPIQNSANICPVCGNAYITSEAITIYSKQTVSNFDINSDENINKVKRLLSVNMISEANDIAYRMQNSCPDSYKARVLDIIVKTNNYTDFDFVNKGLYWDAVQKTEQLRKLDNIQDRDFQNFYQIYNQWIDNNQHIKDLCNQLSPLKAFESLKIVGMYDLDDYRLRKWQSADYYIYRRNLIPRKISLDNTYFQFQSQLGLMITYVLYNGDYHSYDEKSFILKKGISDSAAISLLEKML